MTLIAGNALAQGVYFSSGNPKARGSSFDLTIGAIFDHDGREVAGAFVLKPGHMVQVVSAEVFNLPDTATGHVTYKTDMTKKGVWALTVGIVDPGWKGPISTTLLNFSRVDHALSIGEVFLRVSFFDHAPVPSTSLPSPVSPHDYRRDVQRIAMTQFPKTFLDKNKIALEAGDAALEKAKKAALVWVALIAGLFTTIQLISVAFQAYVLPSISSADPGSIRVEIEALESRLVEIERALTETQQGSYVPLPSEEGASAPPTDQKQ